MTRIDPVTSARLDAGGLRLRHRLAGPNDGDLADGKLITIPPSLAAVQCPACTSRTPSGQGADFVHDTGCALAEELGNQRQADREELLRRREAGEDALVKRPATDAEADQWAAWDTDAADAIVVVQLDEDDEPSYWWPTLQPDC